MQLALDYKTVGFFLKISKKKKVKFGMRVFPDLFFDCSRVLEYAKIRTVLQCKLARIVLVSISKNRTKLKLIVIIIIIIITISRLK